MNPALAIAVAASASMSTGAFLMKRQIDRLAAPNGERRAVPWSAVLRDPRWQLGVALQPVGYGLYILALQRAPLSVVHVMLSGGVVLFVFLAVFGLGERARPLEWAGVFLIIVALLVLGAAAVDAPLSSGAHGLPAFSLGVLALAALAFLVDRSPRRPLGLSVASSLVLGLGSVFAKTLTSEPSLVAALQSSALVATAAANVVGFALMQTALAAGRGVVVMPVLSGLSNLVPIVAAVVVFGESMPSHGADAVLRPLAFGLTILGAGLLGGFGAGAEPHT